MENKVIYEIIGYVALFLNVWGNMALTKKSIKGWIIRLFCNIAWVIYSCYFGVIPLLINHILFAGINILGWHRWSNEPIQTPVDIKTFVSDWLWKSPDRITQNQAWTNEHVSDVKSMLKEFSKKAG